MTNHKEPIVPHVLYVAEQHYSWKLAAYERLATTYHTPTTVMLAFGTIDSSVKRAVGKKGATKQQTGVYCLPDDAAWSRVQVARTHLQQTLDLFADELRLLGSYARRLEQAGGIKQAPNPLSPTVIGVDDPDDDDHHYFVSNPVPRIDRSEISSHTPKMLHVVRDGKPWSTTHQRNTFVCPDDAAWSVIQERQRAVQQAYEAWQALLRELGTYQTALADGRYKKPVVIPQLDLRGPSIAPAPPVPNWPAISPPLIYGHHRNATSGGVTHMWRPSPTPRSKQRHETLCHIVMTEAPTQVAPRQAGESGPRLCPTCRQAASDLVHTQEKPMQTQTTAQASGIWHNLPPKLAGYTWIGERTDPHNPPIAQLKAPDGWTTGAHALSNHAIAEALRRVNTPAGALAVVDSPITGVPMMDPVEAREMIAAMRADIDQVDTSIGNFRRRALDFKEREGWRALGYAGYIEAIQTELGAQYSKSYLSRLLQAAEIERALELPIGNSVPESRLRPLATLDTPEQQRQAWQAATAATNGKPTTGAVQQAVQQIKPTRPNAPAGWVWRESGSLRRLVDGQIAGPFATFEATVAAAERYDQQRADQQHGIAIEQILAKLDQWDDRGQSAQLQEAYGHARQIRDQTTRDRAFARIDAAASGQPAGSVAPIETRGRRLGPGQPEPEPWPEAPDGWRWNRRGPPAHLIAPDGWRTADYNYPDRALAEAQRRILSQPKAAPAASFWQTLSTAHPTAHLWTQEEPQLWRAACGVIAHYAPQGRTEGSHCSSCVRATWKEQPAQVKPTILEAPAHSAPLTRPRRPPSADVSAQLAYLDHLERYATAIEQQLPTTPQAALRLASQLAGERLEDLADQLDDATYEALAAYRRAREPVPTMADLEASR